MTGHPTDKIELIVLGGTWSAYPKEYQYWFIKECFRACNYKNPPQPSPKGGNDSPPLGGVRGDFGLKSEQHKNETAKHRIIGLTLETRPDHINIEEIKQMRDLGCTRIELGAQSLYDDVLKKNRRGHNVAQTIEATKMLKNAGFKINYHMMLNLPGSTILRDEKMFDELFSNPDFQPDLLKIYPCVVLKTAPLYKVWKKGEYKPYSEKELINLILRIKRKIPPYVRVQRIIRDIPGQSIVAGSKITNLRQLIDDSGKKICQCIRCREIRGQYSNTDKIKLVRRDYEASGGKEIFLSYESPDKKKLYALLRLRIPSTETATLPILKNTALIRELHTYGQLISLTANRLPTTATQHKGLGKKLMAEAEKIVSKEFGWAPTSTRRQGKAGHSGKILPKAKSALFGCKKIAVISGIGVRKYYKKLGYKLAQEYMIKGSSH
ncbi:MAG: tRNA uridine(34) 5-carboxymethylaminomethyl modification radical SAM/GNAT enzyme Elp3 [Candidatus Portnoybacteria bacterium]|nr:tRNA uridine(34) 5-carboxymethylaminomethyl modification radical SAM/GNAT enzyme Elp3 [Candidatus Portnoybacteria bacterium]